MMAISVKHMHGKTRQGDRGDRRIMGEGSPVVLAMAMAAKGGGTGP